jgi:hypothetical protein
MFSPVFRGWIGSSRVHNSQNFIYLLGIIHIWCHDFRGGGSTICDALLNFWEVPKEKMWRRGGEGELKSLFLPWHHMWMTPHLKKDPQYLNMMELLSTLYYDGININLKFSWGFFYLNNERKFCEEFHHIRRPWSLFWYAKYIRSL